MWVFLLCARVLTCSLFCVWATGVFGTLFLVLASDSAALSLLGCGCVLHHCSCLPCFSAIIQPTPIDRDTVLGLVWFGTHKTHEKHTWMLKTKCKIFKISKTRAEVESGLRPLNDEEN